MKQNSSYLDDDLAFLLCMILTIAGGLILFSIRFFDIKLTSLFPFPCVIYSTTGLYCPGCGFTRSVNALTLGHLKDSFLFHPLPVIVLFLDCVFLLSQILSRLSHGKIHGLHFRYSYLFGLLGLLIIQCIIKNILA